MKKLLIASTALVATAGMASADITITGHAAAGIYSGLDATAAYVGKLASVPASHTDATQAADVGGVANSGAITAVSAPVAMVAGLATSAAATADEVMALKNAVRAAEKLVADADTELKAINAAADLADAKTNLATATSVAKSNSGDGVYSNAGVDFTMTGATDNGITFSATVNIDAGTEIDTGDFELDGKDGGTAGLGAVSMTGTFGTLTFDDGGIDNLYNGDYTSADVSYSTTVGAISLSVAHDTAGVAQANSMSAAYSASGMAFTLAASEDTNGTSASLSVAYALNDSVSVTGKTDQVAGAESVQTITAATTLNGVSVALSSANNSTWDVDLGYTAGGFALTYGVDETDAWTATATTALGGGATFAAGVSSEDEMYAGVSFAF